MGKQKFWFVRKFEGYLVWAEDMMHPRENAVLGGVTQVSLFWWDGLRNGPVFFS